LLWGDVAVDGASSAVRLRREMEAVFRAPVQRTTYDNVV